MLNPYIRQTAITAKLSAVAYSRAHLPHTYRPGLSPRHVSRRSRVQGPTTRHSSTAKWSRRAQLPTPRTSQSYLYVNPELGNGKASILRRTRESYLSGSCIRRRIQGMLVAAPPRPTPIPVLVGSYGSERTQPSFPRWRRGPRRGIETINRICRHSYSGPTNPGDR